MLPDPIAFTPDESTPVSLPRTSAGQDWAEYTSADGLLVLRVQHQYGTRRRRLIKVTTTKVAEDPISGYNAEISASVHVVIDEPKWGFTDAELQGLCFGLSTFFADGTPDYIDRIVAGEA